ncbi:MAG: hypothetical protein WC837_01965 [Bellilinea sp.]
MLMVLPTFLPTIVPLISAVHPHVRGDIDILIEILENSVLGKSGVVRKEELVYSMALAEATMKVVSDIAEDTYPAVAFQIKDYRKEIERVREEILGDKRENTSLDEVIHGVLSKKTLAAAVIIGGMVLSACGVSVEIVTPNATATETQPRVTETVDIGATETPFQPGVTETAPGVSETPTLEVTPTATQVESEMTVEEIKSNVDAYLDGKITFEGDREKYLYRRRSGLILPVGYFYEYRMTFPQFEIDSDRMISVLLGIYRDESKQFVVLGSKDLRGKLFVWVGITGYLDNEKYPALSRTYIKLTHEESPIIDGSVGNNMFKNQDELLELYSDKINLPLYYGIDANMVIKDPSFTCGPIMNELECGSAKGNNGASDELIAWIKQGKNKPDFVFDNISDFQIKEFENAPLVQNHTVNTP